ncbi:adenylyltransferase/cytidyltransferase family protein [Thermomonas brevis]
MKAIFLGKFQPPHLGHVRTILSVAKEFEHVIVGITMGEPQVIDYGEAKDIMQDVFAHNPKISVQLIEGTIEGGTSNIDSLDFDVVVSGNHKVLEILKERGYVTKFQPRTEGKGYSGSEIRGLIESKSSIYIENRTLGYDFKIVPTSTLKPLEKVFRHHFENIEKMIVADKIIFRPIIIDANNHIVLDGSHRYAFLVKHGYKYAPVISVNYADDSIFVGNHLKHRYLTDSSFVISKSEVIARALNENLFSARTTRHFFPFRKVDYPVALNQLEEGAHRNIDYLLDDSSLSHEIEADRKYIAEIDDELVVMNDYMREQQGVRKYLMRQIEEMEKISGASNDALQLSAEH